MWYTLNLKTKYIIISCKHCFFLYLSTILLITGREGSINYQLYFYLEIYKKSIDEESANEQQAKKNWTKHQHLSKKQ